MRASILLVIGAALASMPAFGALAQADKPKLGATDDSQWHFEIAPYFWLGAMNGTVSKDSVTADIDQNLGDVIDLIDNHLNFGAAIHFEAAHDQWGIFADTMYLDLQAQGTDPNNGESIDAEFKQFLGELGGFYTLVKPAAVAAPPWNPRLDLLGGIRVYSLDSTLTRPSGASNGHSEAWFDPILGIRGEVKPLDWLAIFARADIGGFGLDKGTFSNLSWNVVTAARFDFNSWFGLSLGYRWLDVDYENPSENFTYDVMTSGPFTALVFRF